MRHTITPPSRKRPTLAPVRSPLPMLDAASEAEPDLPFAPARNQDPSRTDIERVDEHRVGGVEAAPHPEPEDAITGFVEPATDEDLQLPAN